MTPHSLATLARQVTDRDHIRGSSKALVTLVEYGDYECPHCGAAHPVVEEIRRLVGDRLRFVFRHFPLTQVHAHAAMAAEAAEAAGAQGSFWEMHGTLLSHQNALDPPSLVQHAVRLGLDTEQFRRSLTAHEFRDRVHEDFMSGVRSGVNGTPTFFINDVRYEGPADLPSLLGAVEVSSAHRVK